MIGAKYCKEYNPLMRYSEKCILKIKMKNLL